MDHNIERDYKDLGLEGMDWISRADSSGLLFRIQQRNFGAHKRRGIFSRSEKQSFAQEVLCSIECAEFGVALIDLSSSLTLTMESICYSEKLVPTYHGTPCVNPDGNNKNIRQSALACYHVVLAWPETSHYSEVLPLICLIFEYVY